jgi:hypothetical protein
MMANQPQFRQTNFGKEKGGYSLCTVPYLCRELHRNKLELIESRAGVFSVNPTPRPVLQIRIRDPVLFYPRDPDPGWIFSGSRISDPGSGPFFDENFLQYLQNPCYVIFITLAYS